MVQPLFFEPDVQFEKVAAEVMLPEDPNEWPNELMQEVFKQVPYIADFEPHVTMDRVDAERGFGFGHIEVQNKTEIQHGADPAAAASAGVKSARIPVVIKDRKLQALDLLVTTDSKVLPLTESRLRSVIFRPQVFDVTGRGPGDMSMVGQLFPPMRNLGGMGGGGTTMNVGMGKESSDEASSMLIPNVDGTFDAHLRGGEHHGKVRRSVSREQMLKLHPPVADFHDKAFGKGKWGPSFGMGKERSVLPGDFLHESNEKHVLEARHFGEGGAKLKPHPKGPRHWRIDAEGRFQPHTPGEKNASAAASLLAAIMPTVNESDYNAFFDKLANDRGLQVALGTNSGAAAALHTLATYEPMPAAKLASAALDHLKPSVAQLRKEVEGYSLKTASHACWLPKTQRMNRGEAVRMFGSKVVIAADQTGAVTMALGEGTTEPGPQQNPEKDTPQLISQFGIYKVQDDSGTELVGYVFPNLIDIDGKSLPIALFTNGSHKAVQGDIVGINVGGGASIPEGKPQGTGAFYQLLSNGRAQALVPMIINASMDTPGEGATVLHGETYDGTPVQVSVQPNITEVTLVDNHLLVPDSFSWLPLDKAVDTHLVETTEGWGAEAEAKQAFATVLLRCGGSDSFALEGFPVDKLASDQRQFLTLDETMFLLAGLGVDLNYAQTKLGEAAAWSRPVQVQVGRYIKTAHQLAAQSREKGAAVVSLFSGVKNTIRKDLLKEAAVIPDPTAVDTVLSLGFLNPENLGTFISYMPVIDDAQSKMCELLLAARLGLRDIPVGALEKAVRSTEEALEGLKILAFQRQ